MLDYDKPPREAKFNYGDTVCYWDNSKGIVVEGIIAFTFKNYYDSEFCDYSYVVEIKDDPIHYDADGSDVCSKKRHTENSLFKSKKECLKAEYKKEKAHLHHLKEAEEDVEIKLRMLEIFMEKVKK